MARGGMYKQLRLCGKRTTPQQAPHQAFWPGLGLHEIFLIAAPGIKVAGNGLRKVVPQAWVRDRPWWKTTVHLSEGAEAEGVGPKPDDPR